ncbi:hypothetical protein FPQ18DRAFT_302719 [Pyronema domesticum]|nr:hypothetical protein FPQ18DRAFT_302719 [Pyronema domesticum]
MIPPNLLSTTSSSWIAQERYYSPYVQLWLFYLFAAFKENEQEDDEMRMDDLDDFLESSSHPKLTPLLTLLCLFLLLLRLHLAHHPDHPASTGPEDPGWDMFLKTPSNNPKEPYTEKTLEECGLDWEDPVQWPNVPAAKQAQAIRRLSLWMRWSQARATAHLIKMSRISVPVDS